MDVIDPRADVFLIVGQRESSPNGSYFKPKYFGCGREYVRSVAAEEMDTFPVRFKPRVDKNRATRKGGCESCLPWSRPSCPTTPPPRRKVNTYQIKFKNTAYSSLSIHTSKRENL